jgi:hypothetical protein
VDDSVVLARGRVVREWAADASSGGTPLDDWSAAGGVTMRIMTHYALGAVALGLLLGGAPVMAQEGGEDANQAQAAAPETRSEKGELAWVDLDKSTFAITTADGQELQFSFTDQTRVAGGDEGVAGLATKTGTSVTVDYEAKDGMAVATAITQGEPEAEQPQPEE